MTTKRLWVCAGAVAMLGGAAHQAHAQQDWIGTAGTLFWDTDSNWNPAFAPNSDVSATFGTVDVAGNPIIIGATSDANQVDFFDNDWEFTGAAGGSLGTGTVIINDPTGTSLVDGTNVLASNGLVWDSGSNAIVGDTGFGSLTVAGGSDYLMRQMFVGNAEGGVGQMTVSGAGSLVRANLNVNVGVFTIGRGGGNGTVNVLDGAQLRTNSTSGNDIWVGGHSDDAGIGSAFISTGTLNVDGPGSFAETEDLQVGVFNGLGFLNITNGGQVVNTDGGGNGSPDTIFANDAGSTGFGLVSGDNSLLRSRRIDVGLDGTALLDVAAGGQARTLTQGTSIGDMFLGTAAGSQGKVAVHGTATDGTTKSLIDVDQNLTVGELGLGVLNVGLDLSDNPVGSGALQVDGNFFIGGGAGNNLNNKVVISGADTTANVGGSLQVGEEGRGLMDVLAGATVTIGNELSVGFVNGAFGTVLIDGAGTTLTAGNAFIGNGSGGGSAGEVTVSGGAVVTLFEPASGTGPAVGAITLGDDGAGVGTLTITGAGSLLETTNADGQWFVGGSGNETGGTGFAHILDGGHGIAGGRTVLGHQPGAVGEMNVDGPGSVFDANGDYILVGFEGTGELNITNGGVVNTTRIFVADATGSANSVVNIDGPGSALNVVGRFHVGDTATGFMNVTNGAQVSVGQDPAAGLRFIIGSGTDSDGSRLLIDGAGSRLDYTGTLDVSVGNAGGSTSNRATLQVNNAAVFSSPSARIIVGDIDNGNGHITVDGPGSRVEAVAMYVGDGTNSSTGLVDITSGGVVELTDELQAGSNGNGVGTVNVTGDGSQLLVGTTLSLGDDLPGNGSATGTLNVVDGGYVSNNGQAYIGHYTGSFGTATLGSATQDDSVWDIGGELTIAGTETSSQGSGSGTLNLNPGGVVNIASNLRVRNLGDVNLTGGELNIGGDLILTDAGSTLNFVFGKLAFTDTGVTTLGPSDLERILQAGGGNRPTLFTNMHLSIAGTANLGGPLRILGGTLSAGTLTPGSITQIDFDTGTLELTASDLTIGAGGLLGENLTVNQGQNLIVTQAINVDAGSTLAVVGDISAGSINASGDLVFVQYAGVKQVAGQINLAASPVTAIGDVQFNGPVSGASDFYGPGTPIFASSYSPGASPAQVQFDGGFGLASSGTLEIEIGGTTPGSEFDQLVIAGTADLAGTLNLQLIDGFMPSLGQQFTIITSSDLGGTTFDTVLGQLLPGGLLFDVQYTPTDVLLSVIEANTPGDTDGDGDIDDSDLGTAFSNYTGPVGLAGGKTFVDGDVDGDGDVDDSDLGTLFSGYTGPIAINVPEPTSVVMLAGLLGLVSRRRR